MASPLLDKLATFYDERTEREQKLLIAMAVTAVLMVLTLMTVLIQSTLVGGREEVAEQRAALRAIATEGSAYLAEVSSVEDLDERLSTNTLRLSSFLEGRASQLNVPRPREFRDHQTPVGNAPGIVQIETTATFPPMTLDQLLDLTEEIEASGELVYIHGVRVQPTRRGEANQLDVEMTLITFRRSGGGS